MKFERFEDEGEFHLIWRVYKSFDKGGKITEVQEAGRVCNELLKVDYDESRHRKLYEGFMKFWKDVKPEYVDDEYIEERLLELEEKQVQTYKEQVKARDQKRELRAMWTLDARAQNLYSIIKESVDKMIEARPFVVNKHPKESNEQIMVVGLNDWHYVETTDNFLNTYTKDEFNRRIDIFYTDIIDRAKKENIRHLKMLNVGDLISGFCKVGIRVANEENVLDQIMQVAEVLSTLFTKLCEHPQIDLVEFYSVNDNHSRMTANHTQNIEAENFGRLIPWYLGSRMSEVGNFRLIENRINEVKELNIGICPIFNEQIFFVHGHLDKPSTVIQDLTLMTRTFPVSVIFGHLHHNFESEVHSIDLIGLPSLIGTADYALSIRRTSLPRQKMIIYSNGVDGKVRRESTHFINLN